MSDLSAIERELGRLGGLMEGVQTSVNRVEGKLDNLETNGCAKAPLHTENVKQLRREMKEMQGGGGLSRGGAVGWASLAGAFGSGAFWSALEWFKANSQWPIAK